MACGYAIKPMLVEVPPYPVFWASTEKRETPFGQVIPMEAA
jgi:hypothetical protein